MFDNLDDFRVFVKRASNLLPECSDDITEASLRMVKGKFFEMKQETLRKRLSADVEMKVSFSVFSPQSNVSL